MAGKAIMCALLALGFGVTTAHALTTITIPDPDSSGGGFIFLGSGSASVTYSGVTFSTSSSLSNGNFFNVGVDFSGSPAVLSSQEQTVGVTNILVTLPSNETVFDVNFGTFDGSAVTFTLSNGDVFSEGSTGAATRHQTFLIYPILVSSIRF